ncbi:MAG: filamentous hemagglutinin family protein, partial [Pedobacter sp.]
NGASRVSVEAARSYSLKETTPATVTAPANANIGDPAQYLADAAAFMTVASDLGPRLFTNVADDQKKYYHLQSGIELVSAVGTDLTLDTAWNLSARPGGETGILTLRAGGNLLINQNLIDAPTAMAKLYSVKSATTEAMQDSWGINLVAGAGNSSSANYLAAETGTGDLTIASGKTVYSENSQINFAAGHDVNLNGSTATAGPGFMINTLMKYNLGSYGGSVRGMAGNNLNLTANGSAIQTALGNIDIRAAGDLNLGTQSNTGAIRTTGEYDNSQKIETMPGTGIFVDAGPSSYWTYHNGGSISLDVAGSVNGNLEAANGWDGAYIDPTVSVKDKVYYPWYLAAGFGGKEKSGGSDVNVPVTVGIATMGGGDITVRTGGELLTQVGAFGSYNQGNLDIVSGGDMIGRFRVMNGTATLTSGGAFGRDESKNPTWRSVIEMADARLSVAAQGDVNLGTVLNPDNSRDRIFFGNTDKKFWNMTYSKDSSAAISSLGGNATFYGTDGFNAYNFTGSSTLLSSLLVRQRVLPVTFTLAAADDLNIRNEFYLAPSTTGNLGLYAGGNLNGAYKKTGESKVSTASIKMADVDVDSYYERQTDTGDKKTAILKADPGPNSRSIVIDHRDDPVPVIVRAGGDIDTVKLVLNKQAEITAGGDIKLLNFIGQNNSVDSVTIVSAQGNIDQGIKSENLSEIKVGGPGTLLVEAGKDINLGNSSGIESIGNSFNRAFTGEDTDSSLIITAGAKQRMLPTDADSGATSLAADYFSILRQAGDDYSNLKAAGKNEEALSRIEDARTEIRKYFDEPTGSDGSGNITMIDSLIRSRKGDIYLMARGDVNVGRSSVSDSAGSKKDTGITTTFGGRLNIYTGGDLNVNESRTMTFMGGDILIWSDQGNINAGRGSKTALSSPESARPDYDNNGVLIGLLAPAPALGSGVRASTYDPDGSGGPLQMPLPGDIYLFAPKGIIDAGEAGIAGGKVTLGATQVLNTKNISFSAGSVGVPTSSDSSVSLGALGGNSNLADSSKMIETATSGGASKENAQRKMVQPMDDFLSKYLDVKVIGFDADTIPASDQDTKDEQERKKKKK